MSSTSALRRRPALIWGPVLGAVPPSVWLAWDMTSEYGLAFDARLTVGVMAWACFSRTAEIFLTHFASTTHRCPKPGCDYTVRLIGTDAAENRRWQEIAHAHPHTPLSR